MKVILDIKDTKAELVLGFLQRLPFVKVRPLTAFQNKVLNDMKQAVDEMHLINEGKLEAGDAKELLNEL